MGNFPFSDSVLDLKELRRPLDLLLVDGGFGSGLLLGDGISQ